MSAGTEQQTLAEVLAQASPRDLATQQRRPEFDSDDSRRCNCGAFVTQRFVRVFGDNGGEIHCCPECSTQRERYQGAAAGLEVSR